MAAMSDNLENEIIDHIFRTATFAKGSVLAFPLLTTAAIDSDTGQFSVGTGVEVINAGAYARQVRNPLDANWAAPTSGDGVTSNVAAITYPEATASWGTVVAIGITDNATFDAGNLILHGVVGTNRTIDTGDTPEFAAGAITVTFG